MTWPTGGDIERAAVLAKKEQEQAELDRQNKEDRQGQQP
jgi:hypothetical protein